MLFNVLRGASYNGNASGNALARDMQTLSYRKSLLPSLPVHWVEDLDERELYQTVMSMPEGPLKEQAYIELMNERSRPQYWYGDTQPRQNTVSSSSWVGPIQYDPTTQVLTMNGYVVQGVTPEDASAVLNGTYSTGQGSVGRSLINLWRLKGTGKNAAIGVPLLPK